MDNIASYFYDVGKKALKLINSLDYDFDVNTIPINAGVHNFDNTPVRIIASMNGYYSCIKNGSFVKIKWGDLTIVKNPFCPS